jgi:hypothetical protein
VGKTSISRNGNSTEPVSSGGRSLTSDRATANKCAKESLHHRGPRNQSGSKGSFSQVLAGPKIARQVTTSATLAPVAYDSATACRFCAKVHDPCRGFVAAANPPLLSSITLSDCTANAARETYAMGNLQAICPDRTVTFGLAKLGFL